MRRLVVLSLLLAACKDNNDIAGEFRSGAACSTAGTCPPGQDCMGGICLRRCSTPGQQCMGNQPCECGNSFGGQPANCDFDGYCRVICGSAGGPPPPQCVSGNQNPPSCPNGQVCDMTTNFCRTPCSGVDGGGCPVGMTCTSVTSLTCSVCAPSSSGVGGVFNGPCKTGDVCNSGLICDPLSHTCQLACGSGPMACGSFGNCQNGFGCDPATNICRPLCQGGTCSNGGTCMTPSGSSCAICFATGSSVTTLATGQTMPTTIAVDMQDVYWTNNGCAPAGPSCPAIAKISIGGAPSATSLFAFPTGSGGNPTALAIDAMNVYFTAQDGRVYRVAKTGGPFTTIGSTEANPTAIRALSDGTVFWTNPGNGTIIRTDSSGGNRMTIASGQSPVRLTVNPVTLQVFWTNSTGTVMYTSTSGGTPMMLANGLLSPTGIANDASGNGVYWTTGDGQIWRAVGGTSPRPIASGQSNPEHIATDGTNVYWTNTGNGTVMKVPVGGGTPQMVAGGQMQPAGIAVDQTGVYWTNQGNGTIMKAPK